MTSSSDRASRDRARPNPSLPEPGALPAAPAERPDDIERAARERFGVRYLFPIQRFVVANVLERNAQIVVLPTGAGKSLCFLLPAVMLAGPSLILMPLRSLLADQERKLASLGIPVGVLQGGLQPQERARMWSDVGRGRLRILLATPEACLAPGNLAALRRLPLAHLVVDEAHCVSEWGDTFRPAYLQVGSLVQALRPGTVSAFTATASDGVLRRIRECLFPDREPRVVRGGADRPTLSYSVQPVLSMDHALGSLLREAERPLLVFCRTRAETELASRSARRRSEGSGGSIFFYHAGLSREERARLEAWFLSSRQGVLFATCAYGMGVDKPDIRTVVHAGVPPSVEAYLQESGRAGRDGLPSKAVLLLESGQELVRLQRLADARSTDRFGRMLDYASNAMHCRRNTLLAMIGQPPVACSGCDVCDGTANSAPEGESAILALIHRYPGRFTPRVAAEVLNGRGGPRAWRGFHDCLRGWASLPAWETPELESAILRLAAAGRLRTACRGPGRGRLAPVRTRGWAVAAAPVESTAHPW